MKYVYVNYMENWNESRQTFISSFGKGQKSSLYQTIAVQLYFLFVTHTTFCLFLKNMKQAKTGWAGSMLNDKVKL